MAYHFIIEYITKNHSYRNVTKTTPMFKSP